MVIGVWVDFVVVGLMCGVVGGLVGFDFHFGTVFGCYFSTLCEISFGLCRCSSVCYVVLFELLYLLGPSFL